MTLGALVQAVAPEEGVLPEWREMESPLPSAHEHGLGRRISDVLGSSGILILPGPPYYGSATATEDIVENWAPVIMEEKRAQEKGEPPPNWFGADVRIAKCNEISDTNAMLDCMGL